MNKKTKKITGNIIIITLILCGVVWIASMFIHIGGEYTNNAQVRQNIVVVSSRVQGFVKKIYFDEFQYVHQGDTLVVLEDSEFSLRVKQAQADYQNALAAKSVMGTTISTTQNNMAVTDANMQEVEILLANARTDYERYKTLLDQKAVTRQQYDAVTTQYESLKAKLKTMQHQKNSTKLLKAEQIQSLDQNEANIAVCEAALDLAKLNLSYTVILAPSNGYTSRKSIQEGELIMPGKNLFSVVSSEKKWVIANYRETQMQHIKIGNKVDIVVDAFPDLKFEGVVASISDATGSQYAVVPQDNSTGNFVKVEQRIPVKIIFTKNNDTKVLDQLQSGMNVECKVLY